MFCHIQKLSNKSSSGSKVAGSGSHTIKGDGSSVWNEVKELGGEAKTVGTHDAAAREGEGGTSLRSLRFSMA